MIWYCAMKRAILTDNYMKLSLQETSERQEYGQKMRLFAQVGGKVMYERLPSVIECPHCNREQKKRSWKHTTQLTVCVHCGRRMQRSELIENNIRSSQLKIYPSSAKSFEDAN